MLCSFFDRNSARHEDSLLPQKTLLQSSIKALNNSHQKIIWFSCSLVSNEYIRGWWTDSVYWRLPERLYKVRSYPICKTSWIETCLWITCSSACPPSQRYNSWIYVVFIEGLGNWTQSFVFFSRTICERILIVMVNLV